MRPKITCHMIASLDGRLLPDRWTDPAEGTVQELIARHYDPAAERLDADGWIVGRRTMAAYVPQGEPPVPLDAPRPRPAHAPDRGGREIGVALDPSARLRFERDAVEGDLPVAVLSERVPDDHLRRLREAGAGYVFAGPDGRDLRAALAALREAFGVRRLLVEGGGATAGAFLAEGLIDAISTLICPAIDGLAGVPAIFDHAGPPGSHPAAGQRLRLAACETLDGGVVWLRHDVIRD